MTQQFNTGNKVIKRLCSYVADQVLFVYILGKEFQFIESIFLHTSRL